MEVNVARNEVPRGFARISSSLFWKRIMDLCSVGLRIRENLIQRMEINLEGHTLNIETVMSNWD